MPDKPTPPHPQAPRALSVIDKRTGKVVRSGTWSNADPRCQIAPYEQRIYNLVAPVGSEPFGSSVPGVREMLDDMDQRLKKLEALVAKHGLV